MGIENIHETDISCPIPCPSTAQLIDKLRGFAGLPYKEFLRLIIEPTQSYLRYGDITFTDTCATTALGEALIKMVEDDK